MPTEILNAFLADTTCETLSKQLQQIWDEVGESDGERNKMLLQINQECLEIYKRKVDQAAKSRAHLITQSRSFLCRALADAKIELSRLGSALGERTIFDKPTRTIKKQLADIGLKLEHLSVLKEKREDEFSDVQSQIRKICGKVAGYSKLTEHAETPTDNEDDLSLEKLDEFRSELKKLQETSDRYRISKVRNLVDAVYDLCFVLGMDFQSFINEVQPNLTDFLEVRSESINIGTLLKLAKAVEHLKKEKIERFEKLQDLARQLIDLWSFMDTYTEERNSFDDVIDNISATVDEVNVHEALSLSSIGHAALEVERLKLKASKMNDERKIMSTRGKTMALLKPDEMIKAKVEAGSSKELLLGQVETWISSCISDGGWKNIIG
ncbi:65-kDa microtubule-associated protein 1-like [Papaver somniferum]|uniref:65-kDa microtubule-associated protein 1-like n=1 Tax=Papaver somniferum TaxID=3469 RepID=UPI000E6F5ED5|nr:65-kDa microtubule-associated protein 1-like [Papaver somniferum]